MKKHAMAMGMAAAAVMGIGMVAAGDDYVIDGAHSGVTFQILHADLTWVPGRFNKFSGDFTIDAADPTRSSFTLTIDANSVDTNNLVRDGHLKSPDYFNTKQYPKIEFASTAVAPIEGGYRVTGDLKLHGETKPVTFDLKGGKTIEMKGAQLTGYSTTFAVKRSAFGVAKKVAPPMLGDDVWVTISFEGKKK